MAQAPLRKASLAIALSLLAAVFGFSYLATTGRIMAALPGAATGKGKLYAFQSDSELRGFLKRLRGRRQTESADNMVMYDVAESAADSAPPGIQAREPAEEGITNNQEVGVDEGGIVKVRGEMLVILRRGRLFTVSLAGGGMRPIDSIDAFPPGVSGQGDWYDEMLLAGDRVIVVGYSYARGGTEINRFRLDSAGGLRFEDSYHLRSNDYYSSRNYASRLIGDRLIFYTPLYLGWQDDPLDALPGLSRWRGDSPHPSFKRIARANHIYIPPALRGEGESQITTLHSVTTCDLAAAELDCTATGVLGPASRDFYVSGESVYLWISDAWSREAERRGARAMIYRLPLEDEAPSAIGARGAPVDQFSFREDSSDDMLNVLVRSEGGGDAMWRPEVSDGDVALLRIPLGEFGDGSREASRQHYRPLPSLPSGSWSFHNRFVGNYVLYGGGAFGESAGASGATLVAAPVDGGTPTRLKLQHAVERIEAMGGDAMIVGGGPGGLGFSAIELGGGQEPRMGDRYVQANSAEGETRSHAFFFKPDPGSPDGASGMLGLPVARRADPAFHRFFGSSAAMLFLRRQDRRLSPAGELAAHMQSVSDDGCHASCVDWYGNARPIFLRGRTFALLGYELVEGRLADSRISEIGRISFAPRSVRRPASGEGQQLVPLGG
jgi:hypothetical protein